MTWSIAIFYLKFDTSLFTGRDDDDDRKRKKKKKRRREDEQSEVIDNEPMDKKAKIDDRSLTVPANSTNHSPNPSRSIRGISN